jgi:hypothetical protein
MVNGFFGRRLWPSLLLGYGMAFEEGAKQKGGANGAALRV